MRKKTPVSGQERYDFSYPAILPFTGREEILKRIKEKLLEGKSIFLCGIRQVGKSRIACRVIELLESRKGCICVEVSMGDVYDCGTPYVEQFANLILAQISEECKKVGVNTAAQKWTPQFVRNVVKQVHEKLGVRIVLFVEELVKYRTWKDIDGTAFLNMLESLVENGDKIGISLCLISQLSMEMIRQKTPGNCGGLWSRLSNNQVFVPPFQKEELALFCNHSSISSQSAIEGLYKRTSGYADLIFPVIHTCEKLSGERHDGLVRRALEKKDLRLRLRANIHETCEAYKEFDLYRIEQISESLRSDYQRMGLIDAYGNFAFSEWLAPVALPSTCVIEGLDKRRGRGKAWHADPKYIGVSLPDNEYAKNQRIKRLWIEGEQRIKAEVKGRQIDADVSNATIGRLFELAFKKCKDNYSLKPSCWWIDIDKEHYDSVTRMLRGSELTKKHILVREEYRVRINPEIFADLPPCASPVPEL